MSERTMRRRARWAAARQAVAAVGLALLGGCNDNAVTLPGLGDLSAGARSDLGGAGDLAGSPPRDLAVAGDLAGGVRFSFFLTSMRAIQEVSGNQEGFGGDLRFGETGAGAGLRGADKICATIAERGLAGAGGKPWRAFLSATADESGNQVNAIDRIGAGPWYDRLGRLFAASKADLLFDRPRGADSAIINDFPNEDGAPNHAPDPNQPAVDNHDTLTGSNTQGKLYSKTATCLDWTSATGNTVTEGKPRVGHSWPRGGGPGGGMNNWMSALDESGCKAGINIVEMGPPDPRAGTVGSGGGYGGIYCFSLEH